MRRGISGKFWAEFWIGVPAAAIAVSAARDSSELIALVVVFGGVAMLALGAALVDAASGRWWAHEPDRISVTLEPVR